jgi:hypothetical protein
LAVCTRCQAVSKSWGMKVTKQEPAETLAKFTAASVPELSGYKAFDVPATMPAAIMFAQTLARIGSV